MLKESVNIEWVYRKLRKRKLASCKLYTYLSGRDGVYVCKEGCVLGVRKEDGNQEVMVPSAGNTVRQFAHA